MVSKKGRSCRNLLFEEGFCRHTQTHTFCITPSLDTKQCLFKGGWRLEAGGWRLDAGRLGAGGWRQEPEGWGAEDWRLGGQRLEAGRLEAVCWRLEVGDWRLEAGRLEAGGWEVGRLETGT